MSRVRRPKVGFLSLSREIRQMILLKTITEDSFRKDKKFHSRLQDLPTAILTKIFGYAADTNLEYNKNRCTCTDCVQRTFMKHLGRRVYAPWLATTIIMDVYGLAPINVLEIAERIGAVHPIVKEDMGWVLHQRLREWALRIQGHSFHGLIYSLDLFCSEWCDERQVKPKTLSWSPHSLLAPRSTRSEVYVSPHGFFYRVPGQSVFLA